VTELGQLAFDNQRGCAGHMRSGGLLVGPGSRHRYVTEATVATTCSKHLASHQPIQTVLAPQ
jgi:hypothetical protein